MNTCRMWGIAPFLLVALLQVTQAKAVPALEARFFDQQGREAYKQGDYAKALRFFLLSSGCSAGPSAFYNVAITAELAKDRVLSFSYWEQYLATSDDDPARRKSAAAHLDRLRRELALIRVTSKPSGAIIFVDRKELGSYGTTPRMIPVEPGLHSVELVLPGFFPVTLQLAAERGKEASASAELTARTGALQVETEPPNATLEFIRDGQPVKAVRLVDSWVLPIGRYLITMRAMGYRPTTVEVTVQEGKTLSVELTATKIRSPTGSVLISATPVAAQVVVDGKPKAVTPAALSELPLGEHLIELRAAGFIPWRRRIRVVPNATEYLNATLRREED